MPPDQPRWSFRHPQATQDRPCFTWSTAISNAGTFDNDATGDVGNSGDFENDERGELQNSGFLNNKRDGKLKNTGKVQNDGGKLVNKGEITNGEDGHLSNSSGGQIKNSGTFINEGLLTSCASEITDRGSIIGAAVTESICWDGDGDGKSWSDPLNWTSDPLLPSGADTIILGADPHLDSVVQLDLPFTLTTGRMIINSGDELVVGRSITLGTSKGAIEIAGTLRVNYGSFTIAAGAVADIAAGLLDNNGGSITNFGYIYNVAERPGLDGVLDNSSGGVVDNYGIIENDAGSLITNFEATFNIHSGGVVNNNFDADLADGGIINNFGAGSDAFLNNAGTINNQHRIRNAQRGTLSNTGVINNFCGGVVLGIVVGNQPIDLCSQP